ncbi:MAG: c-type cytochrome domain-containing protein [Fimbriiglobus sp.]
MKLSLAAVGLVVSALVLPAAEPEKTSGKVSFYKEIRPIFVQQCQGCHQPARANGDYIMTDFASLMKPGETKKPSIVPGKPEASYLIAEILVHDGKAEMPKNRDPLKALEIDLVTRWIKEGATDDTPKTAMVAAITPDKPPVYQAPPVVTSLAFSPDGNTLAVTGYHEIVLHKGDGSAIIGRLIGLSERVQSLAFSPNGKLLAAAAGNPGRSGEVQVWDVEKQNLKFSAPATFDTIYGVSWSPDGSLIAFGCGDNTVRAIDAQTGKQVLFMGTHSDWVLNTIFSVDGKHLVSVSRDMSMKLTEVSTQRFIDNVTSITPGALKGGLIAVDRRPLKEKKMAKVSDDTPNATAQVYDELLCAGSDGKPRLYKMHREVKRVIGDDANKIKEFEAMTGRISSLQFDREGKRFAAASSLDGQGQVWVYDVDTAKPVKCEKITGPVYAVTWSPDGKAVVSSGFDGKIWFHDPATGKLTKDVLAVPMDRKTAAK